MEQGSRAGDETLEFAVEAARLLGDRHCTDIRLLDLRGISQVCDFILIGSGTSDRQMRSVADEIGTWQTSGPQHRRWIYQAMEEAGLTGMQIHLVGGAVCSR